MPSDQARPGWRKCSSIRSPPKIYLVRAIRNAIATAMATIWDAGTDPLGVVRIAGDPHKNSAGTDQSVATPNFRIVRRIRHAAILAAGAA